MRALTRRGTTGRKPQSDSDGGDKSEIKTAKRRGFLGLGSRNASLESPQTPATIGDTTRKTESTYRKTNDDILAKIDQLVDEGDAGSMQNLIISTETAILHCDNLSQMTDDFHHYRPSSYGLSSDSCLGRLTNEQEYDDYIIREDETYPPRHEATALFTFRRRNILESGKEVISETTLNGHIFGEEEESMEDIVKRLQQKGTSSGVLKFDRKEIQQIKDGVKVIVFVLTQVQGAKFGKKEFGRMMASQIADLTPQRPILIEIEAEEIAEGETLDVF